MSVNTQSQISKLPNVGKMLESNLAAIGIATPEALAESGAKEAFLKIRAQVDSGACLHMLYGIEGAIRGVKDSLLPKEVKDDLKSFFNSIYI